MFEQHCPYRSLRSDGTPLCQIVADLTGMPLEICQTNDSACTGCLQCDVPPQRPNFVVASMAIGAALRTDRPDKQTILRQMEPHLRKSPPVTLANTPCLLRGPQTRTVPCKPCQAGSLIPVQVPAYQCQKHNECTLHNTGTFPKIQACATCADRVAPT